jgi:hypothetical protein
MISSGIPSQGVKEIILEPRSGEKLFWIKNIGFGIKVEIILDPGSEGTVSCIRR